MKYSTKIILETIIMVKITSLHCTLQMHPLKYVLLKSSSGSITLRQPSPTDHSIGAMPSLKSDANHNVLNIGVVPSFYRYVVGGTNKFHTTANNFYHEGVTFCWHSQ